jgi:hypothetical protein
MTDTRDDREDAIAAIEQAEESERRRAARIRRKVATQMVPWKLREARRQAVQDRPAGDVED